MRWLSLLAALRCAAGSPPVVPFSLSIGTDRLLPSPYPHELELRCREDEMSYGVFCTHRGPHGRDFYMWCGPPRTARELLAVAMNQLDVRTLAGKCPVDYYCAAHGPMAFRGKAAVTLAADEETRMKIDCLPGPVPRKPQRRHYRKRERGRGRSRGEDQIQGSNQRDGFAPPHDFAAVGGTSRTIDSRPAGRPYRN